ncbi:TnsA endonuclease N-terminal domain-containing protein [Thalassotalea nanhaiensis]|uniref:TnsA endonuclease N-terminal domain-containing protein n=1 Tax=Thalassotalea nanhaiensis TaxID=3065648 RepID=A0ABY9TJE6_9GAMM|nr:TnsA endonuclease N-terminal domain-containing protein [Colwelliaceae bacterium SQ345]
MPKGRKLESIADYQRALKNKYGLGQGSKYKPWLRVQDVKSRGTRSQIFGRKTNREHHLMSLLESELFYLIEFSDRVTDIREQFPILPLNYSQKVAKTLGVEHPKHPKTKEPIVLTTDLLLTVDSESGQYFHAISVKPEEEAGVDRVLQKVEIERICWELMGVKFSFYVGDDLRRIQSENIAWATFPFRKGPSYFSFELVTSALSLLKKKQYYKEDLCEKFIKNNIVNRDESLLLLKYLISEKFIEVDLNYSLGESDVIDIRNIAFEQRRFAYENF